METNKEKDLRIYMHPETEEIRLEFESVIAASGEEGDEGGNI